MATRSHTHTHTHTWWCVQVPVVQIEGSDEFLADSDAIIDHLRAIVSASADTHLREPYESAAGTAEAATVSPSRPVLALLSMHPLQASLPCKAVLLLNTF